MLKKTVLLAAFITTAALVSSQEADAALTPENSSLIAEEKSDAQSQETTGKKIKNYSINLCLRIYDDVNNPVVNSSWSRVTISGKPVTINLRAGNLQIAAVFIPYYVDEKSVVLLSQGKVMLKPVNEAEGKYYSTVDSLPLKIGEKALFFPLGLIDEKMENISSFVLEIEVQHYDKIVESKEEENILLEPAVKSGSEQGRNTTNIKN